MSSDEQKELTPSNTESPTDSAKKEGKTFHHISDVDTWGNPDRNYFLFVVLSFLVGFFGLDHFYLRSYGTGTQKLIMNVLGFGIWYFWDLIQIMKDGKTIRKEGLTSPFDWILGIGRGVFTPLPTDEGAKDVLNKKYAAPKSYLLYTFFAVCLGFFGADRFYIGKPLQGLSKLFCVFNIFLFLFGILWVLWDGFHALFMTDSIMKDGITTPVPFNYIIKSAIPGAELFKVKEVVDEQPKPEKPWSFTDLLPELPKMPPFPTLPIRDIYRAVAEPLIQPSFCAASQKVQTGIEIAKKGAALATAAVGTAPAVVSNVTDQVTNMVSDPTALIQKVAEETAAARKMTGGAIRQSAGLSPVIAGSITALLLAGGAKGMYDFIRQQL